MRWPVLVVTMLALAPGALAPAAGQEVRRVDPVVVTATKIEEPLERLGAAVTVITEDELRTYDYVSTGDALRRVPGVEIIQSGSHGKTTSIRIRGANPNQVQVLVDGMRVKSPTLGTTELADINLDQIERIEVVRGPQSTLYGADAIGGVVNIITRRGRGPFSAYGSFEGGNYDTFRAQTGFGGAAGPFDYSLGGAWFESNGQFANDGTEQRSLAGQIGLRLPANSRVALAARYNRNATELPFDGLTPRRTSPFFVLDPNASQLSETLTLSLQWEQRPVDWLEIRVRGGGYWNWQGFDDPFTPADTARGNADRFVGDFESQVNVERREFELLTAFHAGKWNTLTLAGEHRYESGENTSITAGVRERFTSELTTLSFLVQDELRLFDRFILSGGGRWDNNSEFGSETTFRVSGVALVNETGSKLRTTWAQGFRAPTINDLFFPDSTGGLCPPFGNRDLKPERSVSWDAGVDQQFWQRRVRLSATYFNNQFEDLITTVTVPPTAAGIGAGFDVCFQAGNVGRARTDGLEFAGAFEPLDWLLFDMNYTYTDTEDISARRDLPRFARHRWNFGVTATPLPRLSLFAQAIIVSSQFHAEGFPRNDGYYRVDLGGRYRLTQRQGLFPALDVFGRINNVTDQSYMEALGFPALGINALVGLEARF
jgi:vitamin B12 transporter